MKLLILTAVVSLVNWGPRAHNVTPHNNVIILAQKMDYEINRIKLVIVDFQVENLCLINFSK
jgi:hypothetical protein